MTDLLAHMRRSAIPHAALSLVLAVGYALAASKTKRSRLRGLLIAPTDRMIDASS